MSEEDEYISKSQIKRECDALTELGTELIALTDSQIKTIPMSDSLFAAVMEAKNIRKYSAMKRQRQYVGKLIRKEDWETIQQHLNRLKEPLQQNNARFKKMEQWRDRMLADGDSAVNAFIGEYHDADRQKLRQMAKNAIQEQNTEHPPVHTRKLFKYIREIIENTDDSL